MMFNVLHACYSVYMLHISSPIHVLYRHQPCHHSLHGLALALLAATMCLVHVRVWFRARPVDCTSWLAQAYTRKRCGCRQRTPNKYEDQKLTCGVHQQCLRSSYTERTTKTQIGSADTALQSPKKSFCRGARPRRAPEYHNCIPPVINLCDFWKISYKPYKR